jgi:hypothetical protein
MAAAVAARIDLRLADGVEHLVIDDEFDEIKGNLGTVEKRMNADLMFVPVVSAEGHVPKLSRAKDVRPTDRRVVLGRKKALLELLVDLSQVVSLSCGIQRFSPDPMFLYVEMNRPAENRFRALVLIHNEAIEGIEDDRGRGLE